MVMLILQIDVYCKGTTPNRLTHEQWPLYININVLNILQPKFCTFNIKCKSKGGIFHLAFHTWCAIDLDWVKEYTEC